MKKVWRPKIAPNGVEGAVTSDLLRSLLAKRGLTTQSEIENFLAPDYDRDLHDPFLMLEMARGAARILVAIKDNDRIAIFADYDADGVPGSALLAAFFKQINFQNFTVYIPDRHEEAYGLNNQALAALAQDGVKLIITVDCGVSDVGPVAEANRLGLTAIITDHHLTPEILPDAYAIVNPKRAGDPYPYKMLAGAGVVFKLVQALVRSKNSPAAEDFLTTPINNHWEKWLLDLVAIATVSDLVPLTGENRALVHFGLKGLRQTRRLGLRQLLDELNLAPEFVTEDDIGFSIGPRLNAASRMSHGAEAYALLTAENETEAVRLARHLELKNKERRSRVDEILNSPQLNDLTASPVFVLGNPAWPLGVLGLAAARLTEKYYCPVFLWGENGRQEIKGSCRSDGTVNIVELMKLADELAAPAAGGVNLFLNYGGHAGAGGFSLRRDRLSELTTHLQTAYQQLAKSPTNQDNLLYDSELTLADLTPDTYAVLEKLSPFGLDNPKPIFFLPDLTPVSQRAFGNGANHWELTFRPPGGGTMRAVQFFAPAPAGNPPRRLDLRLRIIDWRAAI